MVQWYMWLLNLLFSIYYILCSLSDAMVIVGKNLEQLCEMCHITLNKIIIFGDNGVITTGGVRIGELPSYVLYFGGTLRL